MQRSACLAGIAWLGTALVVATAAVADQDAGAKEMSPEAKAMMEKWTAAATPHEHHAHLAKLAGTWNARVRFWSAPGAPPDESTGKATFTSIMGGRFLQESFEGAAMGQPFTGMGISGYDNVTKMHTGIWLDSMGTTMMQSEGTCEEACKIIKSRAESSDPMSGKRKVQTSVSRMVSDSEILFEMFDMAPDGKEFKSLEIVYTRHYRGGGPGPSDPRS